MNMMKNICLALVTVNFIGGRILAESIGLGNEVLETGAITCRIKQDIVDMHNKLRENIANGVVANQPAASNMREMYWDDELAETAQNWANHCRFLHNSESERRVARFPFGQSLAYSATSERSTLLMTLRNHIEAWFKEYSHYNFGPIDGNEQNVGHYTQIAWANTYLIGCGQISCIGDWGLPSNIFICNYGPAGNVLGFEPYNRGNKPSCPRHHVLSNKYRNLCSPKKTPSNACATNNENEVENSLEEEITEKPRPRINDATIDLNDHGFTKLFDFMNNRHTTKVHGSASDVAVQLDELLKKFDMSNANYTYDNTHQSNIVLLEGNSISYIKIGNWYTG